MRFKEREPVEFSGTVCKKETDMALLCVIDGKEYWIPKSQIVEGSEVNSEEDEGVLLLTQWISEQKGLL